MDIFKILHKSRLIRFLKKWNLLNIIFGFIDILAISAAFQFSYFLNYKQSDCRIFFCDDVFMIIYFIVTPVWLTILYFINITEIPRTKRYRILFLEYMQSTMVIMLLLITAYFFTRSYGISRLFLLELSLFGFVLLFSVRLLEYVVFKIYRSKGYNNRNIVVICDDTSLSFLETLLDYKEWGFKIVALCTDSELIKSKFEKSITQVPNNCLDNLADLMEVDLIDEVFYFKKDINVTEVRKAIRSCEELGVTFSLKDSNPGNKITNAINTTLANERFLSFTNVPHNSLAITAKRLLDINVSLLLLVVLLPFFIIVAILIKLTSRGPIIFRQGRVGLRGRKFNLYKFRTMIANAEDLQKELADKNEVDGPAFKISNDPRVTRIGRFLRSTGLDELPQLVNVLKGEMSLIGPRPPLQSETSQYKRWQLRRLSVKPGLSCFWQIKPERNNIKFEKWMEMDLAYIDNWSFRLDFIILIRTIKTIFRSSNN